VLLPVVLMLLVSCNRSEKTEYNSDGTIKKKILYTGRDKSNYRELAYNTNKTVSSLQEFTNGIHNGRSFDYYPNGSIKSVFYYDMGQLNSIARYYDKAGRVTDKGLFVNDSMLVKEEFFYNNELTRVNIFSKFSGVFKQAGSLLYNKNGLIGLDNSFYFIVSSADSISLNDSLNVLVDFISQKQKEARISLSLGFIDSNLRFLDSGRTYQSDSLSLAFYYKPRKTGYNLILGKLTYVPDGTKESVREYIFYHDFLVY
jgi:hypothetical protein